MIGDKMIRSGFLGLGVGEWHGCQTLRDLRT